MINFLEKKSKITASKKNKYYTYFLFFTFTITPIIANSNEGMKTALAEILSKKNIEEKDKMMKEYIESANQTIIKEKHLKKITRMPITYFNRDDYDIQGKFLAWNIEYIPDNVKNNNSSPTANEKIYYEDTEFIVSRNLEDLEDCDNINHNSGVLKDGRCFFNTLSIHSYRCYNCSDESEDIQPNASIAKSWQDLIYGLDNDDIFDLYAHSLWTKDQKKSIESVLFLSDHLEYIESLASSESQESLKSLDYYPSRLSNQENDSEGSDSDSENNYRCIPKKIKRFSNFISEIQYAKEEPNIKSFKSKAIEHFSNCVETLRTFLSCSIYLKGEDNSDNIPWLNILTKKGKYNETNKSIEPPLKRCKTR